MSKENKGKVIGYCRVGRAEDASKKVKALMYCRDSMGNEKSFEKQKALLREYAEKKGYEVVGEVCDTDSGMTLKRKGVKEVYALAHRNAMDTVIMTDINRISKNGKLIGCMIGKLDKQNVKVETLDCPAELNAMEVVQNMRRKAFFNM